MPAKRMQSSNTSTNLAAPPTPHQPFPLPLQGHGQPSSPSTSSVKPSPSLPSFTRSASPSSSGLSNFFTRPTKWFTRSSSSSSRASPVEHPAGPGGTRVSTSSVSSNSRRRPTISGPTDPRPIESIGSPGLDAKLAGPGLGMGMPMGMGGLVGLNDRASRSVLDLSSRASTDLNGVPGSRDATGSNGTGDLRSIARKGWSRSVDNLQIIPPSKLTPLNTNTAALEMKIEQYRTGTPTTPGSFSGSLNLNQDRTQQKIYPFPTMPGTPGTPGTPPGEVPLHSLHHAHPHPGQLRHAHSNSGSSVSLGTLGTAGIPSPGARLAPPMASPQKAGRKRSFDFERSKGKSVDAASSFSTSNSTPTRTGGSSGGGVSGFPFFGNVHPERKNSTPVTPTHAPPTIIEPRGRESTTSDEAGESKRASQIVHRSGFIMRLQNYSPLAPAPSLASNKSWKPFKMVLKGSKLYFHKPPGDRAAPIKELFPSGLVAVTEEDVEEEDEHGAAGSGAGGRMNREGEMRKRRAFWGRRTHPELVVEEGKVVKGTLEALVHECVFGTMFPGSNEGSPNNAQDKEKEKENTTPSSSPSSAWQAFASSILFFLPSLVDHAKFEHEFTRCASYFVTGAPDAERDSARERVGWLVKRYVEYYAYRGAVDEERWRAFCREVVPATVHVAAKPASGAGTPTLDSSPNLNTFSPRPIDAERMASLSSAMRLTSSPSPGSPSPSPSAQSIQSASAKSPSNPNANATNARARLWSLLDSAGFTREVFFKLEPETVARSLTLYQRSILAAASGGVGADVLLSEASTTTPNPLVEFFGCEESPHWLTRTVIMQVLGPGPVHSQVDVDNTDEPYPHGHTSPAPGVNSRTHVRAEAIARWARVGEMSRLAGDECSFRAIMGALCAGPVARLEKAWRRVDATAMGIVRAWVAAEASEASSFTSSALPVEERECEREREGEKKVSPWGGDARYRAMKLLEKMQESKSSEWSCEGMYETRRVFDTFATAVEACRSRDAVSRSREASEDEDVSRLVRQWKEMSKKPPPMRIHRINQFMSLSFAAEPKKKGLFAPYYWSRQANHGPQVLIPLLVPELLPTITLVDRSQLVRTKKLSYESGAVLGDLQGTRQTEWMYTIEADGRIRPGGVSATSRHGGGVSGSSAFDLGGMILPVFDGELLLCVVSTPSQADSSRPVSRADGADGAVSGASPNRQPSIRVKSAAAGLDRKSSRARRASLPALSQRERTTPAVVVVEPTGEPPLHAVVQAGTLDALVHFLVHGLEGVSVSVADDNGEMALCDKKTRAVKVDRTEFARVWWPAFRSFVSPYVLFQLLRKDFLSTSPKRGSDSAEEAALAIQARQAVVRVIAEWIRVGGGAQDALDDVELLSAMQTFLAQHAEHDLSKVATKSEELSKLLKDYEAERVALLNAFKAQTMRPQLRSVPVRGQASEDSVHNFGIRPPKLEETTPAELVDNLDAMASAAFRNVNQEDLYVTADLLEVQTSDRTGWFLSREPTSGTDEVEIQSLYTFLMEVEPTSLAGEYSGETLYRLLPPGVRSLLRAFVILRKWAICCLAASQLGVKARQARMEMFLKAIEICRMRSVDPLAVPSDASPIKQPCVRSFVEAVLTSAIVSPESRVFHRAWQAVASARCTQMESVLSLLSTRTVEPMAKRDRLTVDPAWLFERMLEVISLSDVLDSPMDMETPLSLVNFDKRRQLHNIITNTSSYVNRGNRQRREMDRTDFERLNRVEQEISDVIFDLRVLRDEAQREAASLGPPPTPNKKGTPRAFNRVVATQQEKIKRDRYMRERLMKEKRHEQQRLERKEDDLNRAMDSRSHSQSNGQKHMRGKRSMSALFSLMRPISTAFTSESGMMPKRSAAELDFTPTHKPALVLSLVDAHVTPFINNDRSFTFQIDTEDGGHYLLQALSKVDMTQWMQTISTAIKTHAQRRLTYIGNSSPIQVTDHVQPRPATISRDPKAVFGVDLTFLVRREADGEEVPPDAIPSVLELCLKEIEERGLTEQGIYRVAGATSEVTALREALNNGQRYIDRYTDINAVAGVVKYWFRTLPETVIPEPFFDPILEAARISDLDERLAKIREIVHTFPRAHFSVLKRLAEHMDRVVDYEEQNHMTPDNLAVVICPNLLRAPNNNFGLIMTNMGAMTVLFKALITHMHLIFDEDTGEEGDEGEEGEEGDDDEGIEDDEEKAPADALFVPEPDLGPRFVASPEPDELLQESATSSPDP